jgi:hypothetical protein
MTSRPQREALQPRRFVIVDAHRWHVEDIRIGNRSQLDGVNGMPGSMFGMDCTFSPRFEPILTAMDLTVVARNISDEPVRFNGVMLGQVVAPSPYMGSTRPRPSPYGR